MSSSIVIKANIMRKRPSTDAPNMVSEKGPYQRPFFMTAKTSLCVLLRTVVAISMLRIQDTFDRILGAMVIPTPNSLSIGR